MKVRFYSFTKRKNSTKIPTTEAYTELDCTLKEETSILRPSLLVTGNNFNYNYCYIPSFGRYYFIEDIKSYSQGLTLVELSIDYLGSHKTAIGNTNCFIERSSTGWNKDLIDTFCNTLTTVQKNQTNYNAPFMNNRGCYVLTTLADVGGVNGFTQGYLLNALDLYSLNQLIMSLDAGTWLIDSFYSPLETIISCRFFPLDYDTVYSACCSLGTLHLGEYDTTIPVGKIDHVLFNNAFNLLPSPRYTDFRLSSEYTRYDLYIPMYGIIDLPVANYRSLIEAGSNIPCVYTVDLISGGATFGIMYEGGNNPLRIEQVVTHQLGIDIPVAQVQTATSDAGSIGGAIGGYAGGNAISGIPSLILGITSGVLNMAMPTHGYSVLGAVSSRALCALGYYFILTETTIDTEDPDNANYIANWGRPVCETHNVNSHSGYVKCINPHLATQCFDNERKEIEQIMTEGFYYE